VLDGTRTGFGPIDGRGGARALGGRAPALFRLTGMPCRSRSSETSLRAAGPGTGERSRFQLPDPGSPRARQCRRYPRDRSPFHRTSPLWALLREPVRGALGRLAGRRRCRTFSPLYETPARPRARSAFAGRFEAAYALTTSAGGHLHEHDHGSPEHLDPRRTAVGTTAWARAKVAFRSRQPPEVQEVRGRAKPMLDIPDRDCSRRDFAPTPIRSGHLVSQDAVPHRSGATR
jgi:hypothetical protein